MGEGDRRQNAAGAAAQRMLENKGRISAKKLQSLGATWRKTGTRASLSRLYETLIIHQRDGVPAAPILELLGKPTTFDPRDRDYRWRTRERHPIELMILVDREGKLSACKLK